ncbi:hypothetical protein [Ensifer aridi]|uniref:hypothetical protein n=1 Tax=Ensifer aridi TaxID=1708715 RepID=UPI000416E034|nr:hypothetical protein [Ensifer aridi]
MTLSDDEIAAIEKTDMEPGRDHLNVRLLPTEPAGNRAPFDRHLEITRAGGPKD